MAGQSGCNINCATSVGASLNQRCACEVVDVLRLHESIRAAFSESMSDPAVHAHLFSRYALFVDRAALDAMGRVAAALFEVAENPRYRERVLQWAPDIATHYPGSAGGVLGLDFHLTVDGPRLIEVNTNPGGLLLNAVLLDAVRSCAPAAWTTWTTATEAHSAAVAAWLDDARQQSGRAPSRVAIVDSAPREQFLYPEFELYADAFREHGVDCVIRAPEDLRFGPEGLADADGPIDMVYNRLTDFALEEASHADLRQAYLAGDVALTPHPRAHALFADKRNLAVLGDAALLGGFGVDAGLTALLAEVIPTTVEVVPGNRDALWAARNGYFFKPAAGFGSRGSYRGDKLTRRTWESMASATYIAQAFVPPSMRIVHGGQSLKADVRCFASEAGVLLFAARLYQGQTTNMRTPGGGFAAVLTTPLIGE
ncbi:hypothetical protein U5F73_13815 [Stenotrophomonas pavanii]|uniref:Circularly permuted type 2 ATP-grasp protein n=3 Tax=Pseudomonadota TaxID=1224 RepID=A0AB34TIG6_STEMA|nr:hypothetical protein [Stenotrophomonas pavanii]KOO82856.1 hypothetical protein VL23_06235 [Stenotrophomonas maltophilia]MDZ7476060.1 hypothetical protein [Stenotrophomonas pavanii]